MVHLKPSSICPLYAPLSANHLHSQFLQFSSFSTNCNSSIQIIGNRIDQHQLNHHTMPTQGPGTKLVLKGLKLAFPRIAEQRAREEQEDREYSAQKHASRNANGDNQQAPSRHSKAANQEDFNAPEDNVRQESVRRGASVHSNGGYQGSRHQSRGPSRSGSLQQGRSNVPIGASRGSRFEGDVPQENIQRGPSLHSRGSSRSGSLQQGRSNIPNGASRGIRFEDQMPPGNLQREPSMHSNSGNRRSHHQSRGEANFRADIEEVRYTHTPNSSRQHSVRQDGPSRQSRASGGSDNSGPRRTASTQGVVGSRGVSGGRR